jgi:hypothetical protein
MSVQLSPHSIDKSAPPLRQPIDLLGFDRMIHGDLLEQRDFISHDLKVSNRPLPCPGHLRGPEQGLAAEDDARVGFGRGHGGYND